MKLTIPEFCLVLLIGPSGAGKSTFAARHFKKTEVISSDYCRGLVSDDENDQSATADAFDLLNFIVEKRLAARRLAVVDATNVRQEDRQKLIAIARRYHALSVGIVFNLPVKVCLARNKTRPDRQFGAHVVRNQLSALRRSLKRLGREGMRYLYSFKSEEEVEAVTLERQRLWTDLRHRSGPFDLIGDIHGCCDELELLLAELGYGVSRDRAGSYEVTAPAGRQVIFLGDLVDRGPRTPDVLRLVMSMVAAGTALCIMGNHEAKLLRKLRGKNVKLTHGLAETVEQMAAEPAVFHDQVTAFIDGLISHYVLDGGELTVAHAGLRESLQGRSSGAVRAFALYGETTGETDAFGLPVRYNWAKEYRGRAKVVYGHTPVPEAEWLNGTICIDTGCVFGGKLTALRYPELEQVSVPAARVYCEPVRPLVPETADAEGLDAQQQHDALLNIEDVLGKRVISTVLNTNVTLREPNAAAALEVMSRFAIDPRWLIYLPPTMAPPAAAGEEGYLEHPAEVFEDYRSNGVLQAVCQEKHMGSRAVLVVCRDEAAAAQRFGVKGGAAGAVWTRTGRPFFAEPDREAEVLAEIRRAADAAGLWEDLATDWLCLDAEIMPWSMKAQSLLLKQYAPVGAAAEAGLSAANAALAQAVARGVEAAPLLERFVARRQMNAAYRAAYRHYCWPVESLADIRIAPFHLLASEGALHSDKPHSWHRDRLSRLCRGGGLLQATAQRSVDLSDEASCRAATDWWLELTASGGEGMVVKPESFLARSARGLLQPAVKCRGREYLRIIYGADYTAPEHLTRLRRRSLGLKRSLALREFALGLTALSRFVAGAPLRQVHEGVFAVLAFESEPVDPRL